MGKKLYNFIKSILFQKLVKTWTEEDIAGEELRVLCIEENRLAKKDGEDDPDSYVYKVEWKGRARAVKRILFRHNSKDTHRIEREWKLQMKLAHDNVLKIHQLGRTENFKLDQIIG